VNEAELVRWCGWFWNPTEHTCGCGLWKAGAPMLDGGTACPVFAQGNPAYVPEPIRGNPLGKTVVFLASNPGGGADPLDAVESDSCPWWNRNQDAAGTTSTGDWAGVLGTREAFSAYHLGGNTTAALNRDLWVGYESDSVIRTAVGIVAWMQGAISQPRRTGVGEPEWQRFLPDVALVNILHCKSHPSFPAGADHAMSDERRCGHQTWLLLGKLRPPIVIAFGFHAQAWFCAHAGHRRRKERDATSWQWPEGDETVFYWMPHPGRSRHRRTCRKVEELVPRRW